MPEMRPNNYNNLQAIILRGRSQPTDTCIVCPLSYVLGKA